MKSNKMYFYNDKVEYKSKKIKKDIERKSAINLIKTYTNLVYCKDISKIETETGIVKYLLQSQNKENLEIVLSNYLACNESLIKELDDTMKIVEERNSKRLNIGAIVAYVASTALLLGMGYSLYKEFGKVKEENKNTTEIVNDIEENIDTEEVDLNNTVETLEETNRENELLNNPSKLREEIDRLNELKNDEMIKNAEEIKKIKNMPNVIPVETEQVVMYDTSDYINNMDKIRDISTMENVVELDGKTNVKRR